jgi:cysteine desulfurase family protein
MEDITYFDNAATSWPKPPAVRAALDAYFGEGGGNPGRAGHRMSISAARIVEETRDLLAELLAADDPGRMILTKNATEGLNLAIYGLLAPGDHAITSHIEHNSVMRPLRHLESQGLGLTVLANAPDATLDAEMVRAAITPKTRLITTVHGSNVTGTLLPIAQIAAISREHGIPYLVDASQTAGALPIDVTGLGVDLVAFTGHKALLGLTGTGGLYVREGVSPRPFMRGGTGSKSDLEFQPDFLPDAYESGTLNVAGYAGLSAGVRHLLDFGVDNVARHERSLVERFIKGMSKVEGVTIHGPDRIEDRCGVLSFNVDRLAPSEVGTLLDQEYGIMSRVGLHCAPGAHQTIGTFPTGSVRFGFSMMNTDTEVDQAIEAVSDIADWAQERALEDHADA